MTECEPCQGRELSRRLLGCETFTLELTDPDGSVSWNVDKAREFIDAWPGGAARRPTWLVPQSRPGFEFRAGEVDEAHLAHIPAEVLDEPGIGVVLDNTLPDGTQQTLLVQIDGSHRAEIIRRRGSEPELYVLTEEEQAACILMVMREGRRVPMPTLPGPAPTLPR